MIARTKKVWLILALVLPTAFIVAASHLHRTTWAPILFIAFLLAPLWYFNLRRSHILLVDRHL
jgi:hypothetical protein